MHASATINDFLLSSYSLLRIFYIYPWLIGTTGAETMAGGVFRGVGVEVGVVEYPGKFGIW